jgi:hypothetical protein
MGSYLFPPVYSDNSLSQIVMSINLSLSTPEYRSKVSQHPK